MQTIKIEYLIKLRDSLKTGTDDYKAFIVSQPLPWLIARACQPPFPPGNLEGDRDVFLGNLMETIDIMLKDSIAELIIPDSADPWVIADLGQKV